MAQGGSLDLDGDYLIEQFKEIENELKNHQFPQLVVDEDEDADRVLRCPWCAQEAKHNQIIAVNSGIRAVLANELDDDDWEDQQVWFAFDDGDTDFGLPTQVIMLRHSTCGKPVSVPQGWAVRNAS